jgi:hypothetical protein
LSQKPVGLAAVGQISPNPLHDLQPLLLELGDENRERLRMGHVKCLQAVSILLLQSRCSSRNAGKGSFQHALGTFGRPMDEQRDLETSAAPNLQLLKCQLQSLIVRRELAHHRTFIETPPRGRFLKPLHYGPPQRLAKALWACCRQ